MKSKASQLAIILLIGVVILGLTGPVTAQDGIDTSNLNIGDTEAPSETRAGERVEIQSSAEISDLPADWSAQLDFVAYAGDNQIGSQTVSVEDGDKVDVSITHEFQESGSKGVYFEVSGEVKREGPVATQTATVERTTRTVTVDVSPPVTTTEGAAFETPEAIQNEVDNLREEVPQTTGPHAFVLTSTDELYVVFSNQEPQQGYVSVEGVSPDINPLETDGLEFGVIVANDVEFEAPQQASVSEVYQNPESYDREYVEISAHHRYASLDYENEPFSATAGVLVEEPLEASGLFGSMGSKSRMAIDGSDGASINHAIEMPSQERIVTTSFETEYWTDADATVSGIVAAPGSSTRDYIRTFQEDDILSANSDTPVMYVIDEEYNAQDISSVSELSESAGQYDGELVSFESNLYMNTISTKRVVERSTGTQLPPVDTILHGGVAWEQLPQTRDDAIIIMGASSSEQKQLLDSRSGTYQITGEVVSTERIEGEFPQGSILIVYDLERVGSTNTASSNEVIEQLSTSVSDILEQQADPQVDASEVGDTSSEVQNTDEATEESDTDSGSTNTEDEDENPAENPPDAEQDNESDTISRIINSVRDTLNSIQDALSGFFDSI
jgi:hypothetical protein